MVYRETHRGIRRWNEIDNDSRGECLRGTWLCASIQGKQMTGYIDMLPLMVSSLTDMAPDSTRCIRSAQKCHTEETRTVAKCRDIGTGQTRVSAIFPRAEEVVFLLLVWILFFAVFAIGRSS